MRTSVPILFTIPNFITAGSGRAMLNIIERLDRARFAPGVCVTRKGGALDRVVEEMGIPFIEAPFEVDAIPYTQLLPKAWKAAQVFRPHGFQLWHSFHYGSNYTEAIIARMAGARYWVYTKKNMNWYRNAWYVRSLLASRIAVQNTDMMRDFFSSLPFRHRSRLVPRGVDTDRFRPDRFRSLGLRERLGIPDDAVTVSCVAHLLPVKGHPTLVRAAADRSDLHLFLAGRPLDEAYAASLHELVAELGLKSRVHFLGGVGDVPALHGDTDILVLPTQDAGEGCPVSLLEGLASGLPCIATDLPGSRDIVVHKQSGLLVPPEDPEALATALQRLADSRDLRDRLGCGARQRVLEHYTIEREVAGHEALYSDLLGVG